MSHHATMHIFGTARAAATCGSAGLCRAGCTDSELPLEKDSDREGTGGSNPLPVCLDWASGELWLVFLNLSSTCVRELEDRQSSMLVGEAEMKKEVQKQDIMRDFVFFSYKKRERQLRGP